VADSAGNGAGAARPARAPTVLPVVGVSLGVTVAGPGALILHIAAASSVREARKKGESYIYASVKTAIARTSQA
jgi:hypothetical protein